MSSDLAFAEFIDSCLQRFRTDPARFLAEGRIACPSDHKHGATANCYVRHRCRCAECRAARAAAMKANRAYAKRREQRLRAA